MLEFEKTISWDFVLASPEAVSSTGRLPSPAADNHADYQNVESLEKRDEENRWSGVKIACV